MIEGAVGPNGDREEERKLSVLCKLCIARLPV